MMMGSGGVGVGGVNEGLRREGVAHPTVNLRDHYLPLRRRKNETRRP